MINGQPTYSEVAPADEQWVSYVSKLLTNILYLTAARTYRLNE